MRTLSSIAPGWWDYTTLDAAILADAAKLTPQHLSTLGREGFQVHFHDTLEDFYLAEALEYIGAWAEATADNPAGICGPVGPTEQLPLVARLVNALGLSLKHAHFWAMDEWVIGGAEVPLSHPLSFARTNLRLCFDRIDERLKMPREQMHFPTTSSAEYANSFGQVRCAVMQGGQGEVKHWAFNDPFRRKGLFQDVPPSPEEYLALSTRVVPLHPLTIVQNARTSGGGNLSLIPSHAVSVGPAETWKAEKVSIWHAGTHDNPFGIRLTSLMISKKIVDTSVPMSLLARHPDVHFHFFRGGLGSTDVDMH